MDTPRIPPRSLRGAALLAAVLAAVFGLAVLVGASHNFSDVPTTAFYHDAVEWILNRGITSGCAAGLYCPDASTTRAQMAVFMRNLGTALTPTFVQVDGGGNPAPVDPDGTPVICETTPYTPTAYPRTAHIDAWVSLQAGGTMGVQVSTVVSVNGGVYNIPDAWHARAGSAAAGKWMHATQRAVVGLEAGNSYVFGIAIFRDSGTADATDSRCEVMVRIDNRNGTVSPLAPGRTREQGR